MMSRGFEKVPPPSRDTENCSQPSAAQVTYRVPSGPTAAKRLRITQALAVQFRSKGARCKRVADGQPGESMNLVEGTEDENVGAVAHQGNRGAGFEVGSVFEILFVHDERRVLRHLSEKTMEFDRVADSSGGIMRIN
jgi:hypothetical protein